MAPHPAGELMSTIKSTDEGKKVNKLFMENLNELFTHYI